jgi:hypothetical protein
MTRFSRWSFGDVQAYTSAMSAWGFATVEGESRWSDARAESIGAMAKTNKTAVAVGALILKPHFGMDDNIRRRYGACYCTIVLQQPDVSGVQQGNLVTSVDRVLAGGQEQVDAKPLGRHGLERSRGGRGAMPRPVSHYKSRGLPWGRSRSCSLAEFIAFSTVRPSPAQLRVVAVTGMMPPRRSPLASIWSKGPCD